MGGEEVMENLAREQEGLQGEGPGLLEHGPGSNLGRCEGDTEMHPTSLPWLAQAAAAECPRGAFPGAPAAEAR